MKVKPLKVKPLKSGLSLNGHVFYSFVSMLFIHTKHKAALQFIDVPLHKTLTCPIGFPFSV